MGGHSLVKMNDLQAAFAAAGCRNVRTYIASGNVVFDAPTALDALRPRIQKKVDALLGGRAAILFRSLREVEQIVEAAPFGPLVNDRAIKLYVAFLAQTPTRKPSFPLTFPKEALEAIGMKKNDVLIVSRQKPNGWYGFPANWIERELGVTATARTWSTVTKLLKIIS